MNKMNLPMQKLQRKSRRFWLICVGVLCLAHLSWQRLHARVILRNQSGQPLSQFTLIFRGYAAADDKRVTFHDVSIRDQQWEPFDSEWGHHDSVRVIEMKGQTADGSKMKLKSKCIYPIEYAGILGERLIVTIKPHEDIDEISYD